MDLLHQGISLDLILLLVDCPEPDEYLSDDDLGDSL
jgi:hypothetical protein